MRDRTAIVTGAASGIGRALTEQLTAAGTNVLGIDMDATMTPLEQTALPIIHYFFIGQLQFVKISF